MRRGTTGGAGAIPLPCGVDFVVEGGVHEALQVAQEELARRAALRNGTVVLFRALFDGRTDAYGLEDPASGRGSCVKEPLTDRVIAQHLRGERRVGIYLLRDDGTIRFAVVDFDGGEEDLAAAIRFCKAAEAAELPPCLERSKRRGFHVWIFFVEAVPAQLARRALRHLLDQTELANNTEVFPKQDAADRVTFGNYVYLPLNGLAQVKQGRTAFLDWQNSGKQFDDPLAPLRNVRLAERGALERLLASASTGEATGAMRPAPAHAPSPGSAIEMARLRPLLDAIRTRGVDAGQGGLRHAAALLLGYVFQQEGWSLDTALAMAREVNVRSFRPALENGDLRHQIEDTYERGWLVSALALGKLRLALGLDGKDGSREPAPAPITYLDLESVKANGIPPIRWHISGWLAEGDIALLAGAGAVGKSTTVACLAVDLASGRPWCGLTPARSCRVLFFDEEQGEATTARLFLRLGAPCHDLLVASGQGLRLDTPEGIARLEGEIARHRAEVVIIDSVQQAFGSADENSATAVGAVYRELFRLRDTYGVTFVLVHHKRKSSSEVRAEMLELVRGSTAHGTQPSTVWYGSAGEGGRCLDLVQAKRRGYSKQSLRIAYREDGTDGAIILTGEGPVESKDSQLSRVSEWVVEFLADKDEAKRAAIVEAGRFLGYQDDAVDEALGHLVRLGRAEKPNRGWYRLKKAEP